MYQINNESLWKIISPIFEKRKSEIEEENEAFECFYGNNGKTIIFNIRNKETDRLYLLKFPFPPNSNIIRIGSQAAKPLRAIFWNDYDLPENIEDLQNFINKKINELLVQARE